MAVWLPSSITPQLSWLKTGLTEGYGGQNSFLPPTLGHFPFGSWESSQVAVAGGLRSRQTLERQDLGSQKTERIGRGWKASSVLEV